MSEQELAIKTEKLCKKVGSKLVLADIDLQVYHGEIHGLLGPNGSGKSVLLSILSTSIKPSSGNAYILGYDLLHEPEKIRSVIGYAPESFHAFQNLKVREYINFFAEAYKIPKEDRNTIVSDVIELMELTDVKDFPIHELSSGMKKRLLLGRAIIHDPEVLIMDEPLVGLDPKARIEFGEMLKELRDMGKTILISSNNLTELSSLCDGFSILSNGKLVFSSDKASLRKGESFVFEIEIKEPVENVIEMLQGISFLSGIETKGNMVKIQSLQENINPILLELINNDITVLSVRKSTLNIEDIYFRTLYSS